MIAKAFFCLRFKAAFKKPDMALPFHTHDSASPAIGMAFNAKKMVIFSQIPSLDIRHDWAQVNETEK